MIELMKESVETQLVPLPGEGSGVGINIASRSDTFNQEKRQTIGFAVLIPCGALNCFFYLSDEVTKGNLIRRMRVMVRS